MLICDKCWTDPSLLSARITPSKDISPSSGSMDELVHPQENVQIQPATGNHDILPTAPNNDP